GLRSGEKSTVGATRSEVMLRHGTERLSGGVVRRMTERELEVAAVLGGLPALDERAIGRLCVQVLEKFHVHLVVCTADLRIVFATRSAKAILRRCDDGPAARGAEIGPALVAAVNQYLSRRQEGRRAA